jgi:transcriptional accessory protein Tex/SPT6
VPAKNELEDIYLPFKPKNAPGNIAREKGLLPLAESIKQLNVPHSPAPTSTRLPQHMSTPAKACSRPGRARRRFRHHCEEISEMADLRQLQEISSSAPAYLFRP